MGEQEEAEAAYLHAKEQRDKWLSLVPQTLASQNHAAIWQDEMNKFEWCLPGAVGALDSEEE